MSDPLDHVTRRVTALEARVDAVSVVADRALTTANAAQAGTAANVTAIATLQNDVHAIKVETSSQTTQLSRLVSSDDERILREKISAEQNAKRIAKADTTLRWVQGVVALITLIGLVAGFVAWIVPHWH